VLWLGLLFGAAWGTGRTISIAGAGISAEPWQENTARSLISLGSIGSVIAIAALLVQWRWSA
jgi:hypothetical protein